MISIAFANVAGGRLIGSDGYDAADRTADFGQALAGLRPDVLIVTELDPDSDQLERLTAAAMPGRKVHHVRHGFSESHIPGVERLGVGIASTYPLTELERIDLPNPSIDFLHWRTGEPMDPHPKGFLVARGDFGALGEVDLVGGQVCPIHMFRSASGVEYTYREGPGRKFGTQMTAYLREELAARGVRRAVVAGDLNMPNPREFFGETLGLVDAFGDPPPITTPDGRSIDRLFSTPDLVARDVKVAQMPGADHFPVACQLTRRHPETQPIGRIREQDLARPPARSGPAGMRRGLTR
ncbi:endonuclease/exonuclease/phosphatase family metal-dependent hydrolase [Kribbella sp. VKM Ac-2571]|uniref:endonuclease/exonuclease/phosphatase family protein n=1 Tax=Kribbella sp. VKM Ac-2571 TaxID=2512222 RepID=UPI0010610BDF|nr:endonuclease/exonuclease/phosphatase family protein [Kribbella sp. VKM Ac-2571]TDO56086.1 endonuclease/exonuclease/phosphatase family metal-dependent hydrolase [Kribbella sp. VKM Ac-2571]